MNPRLEFPTFSHHKPAQAGCNQAEAAQSSEEEQKEIILWRASSLAQAGDCPVHNNTLDWKHIEEK